MNILTKVTPLNLLEEKTRFFASSTYNPQFEYPVSTPVSELQSWGQPSAATAEFVRRHLPLLPSETPNPQSLTPSEIETALKNVLQQLGLDHQLEVRFDENLVSKCKIELSTLTFRLPLAYHRHELQGVINHEVQTHLLRRRNHRLQPWSQRPRSDAEFRATEEGLALLNAYYGSGEQSMIGSYTAYYAIYLSQATSFREGFETLKSLGLDEDRAWRLMVRGKRGISDTSQAQGGLTKDICYLMGAAEVWRWLMQPTNDPHHLYWGRVNLAELPHLATEVILEGLIYPTFFTDIPHYINQLHTLGTVNFLDTIPVTYSS